METNLTLWSVHSETLSESWVRWQRQGPDARLPNVGHSLPECLLCTLEFCEKYLEDFLTCVSYIAPRSAFLTRVINTF